MKTVVGVFEAGQAARAAVRKLHEAGFTENDIAFVLNANPAGRSRPHAGRAGDAGRRLGEMAMDAADSALSFVPFIGRDLAAGPFGAAMRESLASTTAAVAGVLGALTRGGFTARQAEDLGRAGGAAVLLRAEDSRAVEAAAILAEAGAVAVDAAAVPTEPQCS
ncbi:MAG TPA: hypothetical protein VGM37_04175 [Armatimonadota bacterium]